MLIGSNHSSTREKILDFYSVLTAAERWIRVSKHDFSLEKSHGDSSNFDAWH